MDSRTQALIREYRASRDPSIAQRIIAQLIRSGDLSNDIVNLLAVAGNETAQDTLGFRGSQQVTPTPPSLYFTSGHGADPNILQDLDAEAALEGTAGPAQEVERIRWIQVVFKDMKFLWFIIVRRLLRKIHSEVFQSQHQELLEKLLHYDARHLEGRRKRRALKQEGFLPGHQVENGQFEYQLLKSQSDDAITLLEQISPNTSYPDQRRLNTLGAQISAWAGITCDEGYLRIGDPLPSSIEADTFDNDRDWAFCLYNFVETLHHLFLALVGSPGIPYRRGEGRPLADYTGSPFLYHWKREHGTLNPGHHLNHGALVRLNELMNEKGQINWYVVYSNCLVGCYLSNTFYLSATARHSLHAPQTPVELEELGAQYEVLEARMDELLDRFLRSRNDYSRAQQSVNRAEARVNTLIMHDFDETDPDFIAADQRLQAAQNRLEQIVDSVHQAHPEIPEIISQYTMMGERLELLQRQTAASEEEILENNFWEEMGPTIQLAITDYLCL